MGKRSMVSGSLKSAKQAKVALSKTTYKPLVNQALLKAVSKTVNAIDKVLVGERKLSVNLGGLLAKLKGEFSIHLKKVEKPPSDYQIKTAFHNFVQVRFKVGESRTNEYMRLAEREDLHRLGLPTSVLIELSRLEPDALKEFKKKHPTAELKKLSFKAVRKLIRGDNENKRNKAVKNEDRKETPQVIAEKLKSTFEIVRDKFEDEPEIDKEIYSVIGEMSKWLVDKKAA
ncbi:MAG: hypothetical protein H6625_03990 [Bdellovibrionaceae bacterium]|nr:hypothetical protein [Pseudobdellovibrionaceae bacterium]